MGHRTRLVIGSLVTTLTAGTLLAVGAGAGEASERGASSPDRAALAAGRLAADASGSLRLEHEDGRTVFVGVKAGDEVDNPDVTSSTSVAAAARSAVDRYGAALGSSQTGTTLVQTRATPTVSGQDAVRFDQSVDGVPVIGGQLVVNLREDRELGSMLSTLTTQTKVKAPVVSEAAAAKAAGAAAAKAGKTAVSAQSVESQGRRVFDASLFDPNTQLAARTVWQFEVSNGPVARRLVLVDDQTGGVLLNLDQIQGIDRVVCDKNNVRGEPALCTSGFARTEGGAASGVADVNDAFTLSGEVSTYYDQIGGIDLTNALGIDVGGVKKLASTVRFCYPSNTGSACPLQNAFWNGQQMYYGTGYASADDVVGHEMTHGIIDQYSQLFYWGQSGAMNESIADIMGEIVDHRNVNTGDSATSWTIGEDLPIGAIRDLKTPAVYAQPDRMTSNLYEVESTDYYDNDGVHTNSGVGNKTAYLISQGGTFNGQTITGIDTGDANLTKTAKLYLDVIQSLTSGSDYADLARVLDQSCQNLLGAGNAGFTQADCTNVHAATLATELRTTPTNGPQPADAAASCPTGSTKRVLFDSETGANPTAKFTTTGGAWVRDQPSFLGSNATSGLTSWFGVNPDPFNFGDNNSYALVMANSINVPKGQKTYLWFQGWRLYEYNGTQYFDGGTVEVDDLGTPAGALDTAGMTWVNGPKQTLFSWSGNPFSGKKAFGGDSRGWVASRLDLSSFAGKQVKPRFTTRGDAGGSYIGWYLDDVRVYTCDLKSFTAAPKPTISGNAKVGAKLTANPGTWKPAGVTFSYQWLRGGNPISGAKAKTYSLKAADKGKKISVKVTGTKTGYKTVTVTSAAKGPIK